MIEVVEKPVKLPEPTDREREFFLNGMIYALRVAEQAAGREPATIWLSLTTNGDRDHKKMVADVETAIAAIGKRE